jgi:hypothetical protein
MLLVACNYVNNVKKDLFGFVLGINVFLKMQQLSYFCR